MYVGVRFGARNKVPPPYEFPEAPEWLIFLLRLHQEYLVLQGCDLGIRKMIKYRNVSKLTKSRAMMGNCAKSMWEYVLGPGIRYHSLRLS